MLRSLLLVLTLTLSGCATRQSPLAPHDLPVFTQRVAYNLYIPILCDSRINGTGFPVGLHMVMTAQHVVDNCPGMAVSLDRGVTWHPVSHDAVFSHGTYDVSMIVLPEVTFNSVAQLRTPRLGEKTHSYGSAFGRDGHLMHGEVSRVETMVAFYDMTPIGGMSGSAVIGEDGFVIGMVNVAQRDPRVGGVLSAGITGDFLATLLESFLEYKAQEGI